MKYTLALALGLGASALRILMPTMSPNHILSTVDSTATHEPQVTTLNTSHSSSHAHSHPLSPLLRRDDGDEFPYSWFDGEYLSPSRIIPIAATLAHPYPADNLRGAISSTFRTLLTFTIPASYASRNCSLIISLPPIEPIPWYPMDLDTYHPKPPRAYYFTGDGRINFHQYRNLPINWVWDYRLIHSLVKDSVKGFYGGVVVKPGQARVARRELCRAGETITLRMKSADECNFSWKQEYNNTRAGVYIVPDVIVDI